MRSLETIFSTVGAGILLVSIQWLSLVSIGARMSFNKKNQRSNGMFVSCKSQQSPLAIASRLKPFETLDALSYRATRYGPEYVQRIKVRIAQEKRE